MLFLRSAFVLLIISIANAANILGVFPLMSRSHHILGCALLKELALRGHQVTMISPFPLEKPHVNYKDIFLESPLKMMENKKIMEIFKTLLSTDNDPFTKTFGYDKMVMEAMDIFLDDPKLVEYLNSKPKIDVVIQLWSFSEGLLGIGDQLGAPTIGFSIMGGFPVLNYQTNVPAPYSYVPNLFTPYTDSMNFWERLTNTLVNIITDIHLTFRHMPRQRELLKKFFPKAPSLDVLLDQVDLHLVATHPTFEPPKPYLPNMIQIGGFHLYENVTLDGSFKKYLDESKNGVILFSFGSNAKSSMIPDGVINEMLKSFAKSKYDILWKFDKNFENKSKNVRIENWLPQRAILAHPKVKGFITHAGLGSIVEGIHCGVPMIAIPLFGDQNKNTADGTQYGYLTHLKLNEITEDSLTRAIKEITENKKYIENIRYRSDMLRNQEINPMDRAVYWVEHVVKHKNAKHLKSKAANLVWYQYYLLDVALFITTILLALLILSYLILKFIFGLCFVKKTRKEKKVKRN